MICPKCQSTEMNAALLHADGTSVWACDDCGYRRTRPPVDHKPTINWGPVIGLICLGASAGLVIAFIVECLR